MDFLNSYILPLYVVTFLFAAASGFFALVRRFERPIFLLLAAFWAACALLRPFFVSFDDGNYAVHLQMVCSFSECGFDDRMGYSYLYYLIVGVAKNYFDSVSIFLAMAATFFVGKVLLIGRMTAYSLPALLTYVSIFFLLHDVTQFRAAAAAFFLLLTLRLVSERRFAKGLASWIIGMLLHLQAVVTPAFLVVKVIFRQHYWTAIAAVVVTQLFSQVGLVPTNLALSAASAVMQGARLDVALESGEVGVRTTSLAILLLLAQSVPMVRRMQDNRVYVYAFYSVVAGFLLYWVGARFDTVSSRLAQFLWIPIVLLAPLSRRRPIFFFGLLGVSASFFYLQGWVIRLMDPLV